ncbi:hypothetical protein LIER_30143 [Lithospermum erythrorhizon]|uniref:Uncharacterized protein n=1 Tax=Lithospermum erythrorhizon TaxID=34254 RepID=A0AAV3RLP7_LITER
MYGTLLLLGISLLCLSSFVQYHNGIKSNPLQSLLSPNCSLRNSDNIVSEYQDTDEYKPVYIGPLDGLKEVDKIVSLPGQPIYSGSLEDLVALQLDMHGAFMELGPFRVNPDGKTLWQNKYAWNNGSKKHYSFF